MTAPPIGYFGSKVRAAPKIVDLMPPRRTARRSRGGPSIFEVVNDLDRDPSNACPRSNTPKESP